MTEPLNIFLVWTGTKYGPEYIERVTDMIGRNVSNTPREIRWWCITDRPEDVRNCWEGLDSFGTIDAALTGWWAKLQLFSPHLPISWGERCFYCDLDNLITGRLEDLVERPGITRDWMTGALQTSAMVWDHGQHQEVWSRFWALSPDQQREVMNQDLPGYVQPYGDQDWLTQVDEGNWTLWPSEWCKSYRMHALEWPPAMCKIVFCHGQPKPHEITEGWVPEVWKIGGLTSLPELKGMNVAPEKALANVRANVYRYTPSPDNPDPVRSLPWFSGFGVINRELCLVCGGPSLKNSLRDIRERARKGACILTVNAAWRVLAKAGIKVSCHAVMDARPDNAALLEGLPSTVRVFAASQCDPEVFEALAGHDVIMWHNLIGDPETYREILAPWWGPDDPDATAGPYDQPAVLIPGGCTVGLRALWLGYFSGYRKIHVYGMDSSYSGGDHHAYAQPLNDGETTVDIVHGPNTYKCAIWMARQAEEFMETWRDLTRQGVSLYVHGEGLIPAIWRTLRSPSEAARSPALSPPS